MIRIASIICVVSSLVCAPSAAYASETGCEDTIELDRFQTLRQLSLDLFGRVPSESELTALIDNSEVPVEQVDAMLASDEFNNFVKRYHEDLLWPQLENGNVANVGLSILLPSSFFDLGSPESDRLFLLSVGLYRRGGVVPCKNEPAEFDNNGVPIAEHFQDDNTWREGYVMVNPYWAPDTQIKVCAYEASLLPTTDKGAACDKPDGFYTGYCGCGPGLQRCLSIQSATTIIASLRQQILKMAINPIAEGRSYFDLLTEPVEELNGPLVHYYRYVAPLVGDPFIIAPPILPHLLPTNVTYMDTAWQSYKRPQEHSGVLTSLTYLLRFQTPRARAAHFYDAFLCKPFQAPEVPLPSPSDPCSDEPDLRLRCGCNMCHNGLEPAASYWSRFADAGTMFLHKSYFPTHRDDCATCAENPNTPCDFMCDRFYLTEAGHPKEEKWLGTMQSLVFASAEEVASADAGPKALVQKMLDNGYLEECTINRVFQTLMRRPMTKTEEDTLRPQLTEAFSSSNYNFKALIRAVVTAEPYGRLVR